MGGGGIWWTGVMTIESERSRWNWDMFVGRGRKRVGSRLKMGNKRKSGKETTECLAYAMGGGWNCLLRKEEL